MHPTDRANLITLALHYIERLLFDIRLLRRELDAMVKRLDGMCDV